MCGCDTTKNVKFAKNVKIKVFHSFGTVDEKMLKLLELFVGAACEMRKNVEI